MNSITIRLTLPPAAVKPNARFHWSKKAKETKAYRRESWGDCVWQIKSPPPRWKKATFKAVAYFPTLRFPDPDNFIASLKAALDGIIDAGIVANDKDLWPLRPEFHKDAKSPRVEITITEEP